MKKLERIAIKYFIVGIGVGLLKALFVVSPQFYLGYLNFDYYESVRLISAYLVAYLPNIIVGTFLIYDSFKLTKNKILIPVLGFCLPVFGVCFLIMEKFILIKLDNNA